MGEENNYSPYIIIGKLSRDFILTDKGEDVSDIPGGHIIYTAIGMSPKEKHPGIVARIGKNYPEKFLELLKKYEFSTHGIKKVDSNLDQRNFISFFQQEFFNDADPRKQLSVLSQYFKAGKSFPKELLGYNKKINNGDSLTERTAETILARDIPSEYLEARSIHLCPLDYLSHNLLPQAFPGGNQRTITIHAGNGYMHPYFFEGVKTLVNGVTAFIVRERQVRNLFFEKYRISKLEDMMKILLDYGAENIVIKQEDRSYIFINRGDLIVKKLRIEIEGPYEKIGELSCFCGGYIVGLNETYDYIKAVALGVARASMLQNDWNPYNNLNIFETLLDEKARILENRIEG